MTLALLLIGSYLVGAIPFGVIVAKAHGVDIMSVGSGNIGATNVIRALGKKAGFLVFFLDVLKGLVPALVARSLFPDQQVLWFVAGAVAVIGHSLSPFLRFKGGKGISTALGMMIATSPIVALCAFVTFAIVLATSRYMSLASLVGVTSTLVYGFIFRDDPRVLAGYAVMILFVIYRHRANVVRLRNGTEPRFSFSRTIPKPTEGESDPLHPAPDAERKPAPQE